MPVSAPTLIASYASTSNSLTSNAVTATASAAVGDLVFVVIGSGQIGQTLGVSDSAGNTWTALDAVACSGVATYTGRLHYSFLTAAITSGVSTFTATCSTSAGLTFLVHKMTGAASVGAQVSGFSDTAVLTATTSTAATTVADGVLYVAAVTVIARTLTAAGSLIATDNIAASGTGSPRRTWGFYQATTAGSATPSATFDANGTYVMLAAPIAPSGGGTVPGAISNLAGTAGNNQVVLTWTAPADGGSAITDYVVQFREA